VTDGFAQILIDLDRCEHGRHQGDPCFDCPDGLSAGNPYMKTGEVIGFGYDGGLILLPDKGVKTNPEAWRAPKPGAGEP